MFGNRYFARRYYPDRYYPPGMEAAVAVIVLLGSLLGATTAASVTPTVEIAGSWVAVSGAGSYVPLIPSPLVASALDTEITGSWVQIVVLAGSAGSVALAGSYVLSATLIGALEQARALAGAFDQLDLEGSNG